MAQTNRQLIDQLVIWSYLALFNVAALYESVRQQRRHCNYRALHTHVAVQHATQRQEKAAFVRIQLSGGGCYLLLFLFDSILLGF